MRDKYVGYIDQHGTWDMKISEGWLTEEIWKERRRSYWTGISFGFMAGMAAMAILVGIFQ